MVTVVVDPKFNLPKERLMEIMSERNIDTRPFFHPLSSIPAYRDTEQGREARIRNQVSYRISPTGLNFPSGLNMTEEKVAYVCGVLREVLKAHATDEHLGIGR
jgi:perosamine synthetase